jgi:hypothetical protein
MIIHEGDHEETSEGTNEVRKSVMSSPDASRYQDFVQWFIPRPVGEGPLKGFQFISVKIVGVNNMLTSKQKDPAMIYR